MQRDATDRPAKWCEKQETRIVQGASVNADARESQSATTVLVALSITSAAAAAVCNFCSPVLPNKYYD